MERHRFAVVSLTLALVLGFPLPAQGQEVYLGARGGISVTDYSLPYLGEDLRSGLVAGAFLAIPAGDHLSLQPEISWVRKGAKWFKEGWGPLRADLDYAVVSALARLSLPLGSTFSLDLQVGPWAGMLGACGTDPVSEQHDCEFVFGADDHKSIDFGWTIGMGAALRTGAWITQLDVRSARGVSKVLKHRPNDNPTTRSLQFSIGVGRRISGG